ncbi:hypothetical protein ERJ75_000716500 [Trypanosoma vivax]|uniref:Uncharacterized protein n=1 Tax=Trypanosoma vivax (strain Y486) TaxID=1055687 RepID=G0TWN7_TRYVY|nr:hypothetical protein TRVL_07840 [Trypanosoma vivax]KAH8614085.1 hypothetical protein ERJ75_000716500 [Trypanosoma vivax]CCC48375.1 conserved hypothetical protein [Trypanosoma vivax Y486]
MKRLIVKSPLLYIGLRSVFVGSDISSRTPSPVPVFGRRRYQNSESNDSSVYRIENHSDHVLVSSEDESYAKKMCFEKYGFVQRPLVVKSWTEFLRELRRVELRWRLIPSFSGLIVLDIIEHTKDAETLLCSLKTSSSSTPIANFFDCCGKIIQGTTDKGIIPFPDPVCNGSILEIKSKRYIVPNEEKGILSEEPVSPVIAQYNCRGISVDLTVTDTATNIEKSIFTNLPMQVLTYAFLSSIPVFLKRTDSGVRNVDFVSKDQMRHFRFAWCFLRRESLLTAVDMSELDILLPPLV